MDSDVIDNDIVSGDDSEAPTEEVIEEVSEGIYTEDDLEPLPEDEPEETPAEIIEAIEELTEAVEEVAEALEDDTKVYEKGAEDEDDN